jgi:hypothetical protein
MTWCTWISDVASAEFHPELAKGLSHQRKVILNLIQALIVLVFAYLKQTLNQVQGDVLLINCVETKITPFLPQAQPSLPTTSRHRREALPCVGGIRCRSIF